MSLSFFGVFFWFQKTFMSDIATWRHFFRPQDQSFGVWNRSTDPWWKQPSRGKKGWCTRGFEALNFLRLVHLKITTIWKGKESEANLHDLGVQNVNFTGCNQNDPCILQILPSRICTPGRLNDLVKKPDKFTGQAKTAEGLEVSFQILTSCGHGRNEAVNYHKVIYGEWYSIRSF